MSIVLRLPEEQHLLQYASKRSFQTLILVHKCIQTLNGPGNILFCSYSKRKKVA